MYSVKGVYTKRMDKTLSVGTSVWLKAPYGEFIISKYIEENETAVLIAGGTGVYTNGDKTIPLKRHNHFDRITANELCKQAEFGKQL